MKPILILLLILSHASCSFCQDYRVCKVYCFNNGDSSHKLLFAENRYNDNHKIEYQNYHLEFDNFRVFPSYRRKEEIFYYYSDTALIKKVSVSSDDSVVELYRYNKLGQKIVTDIYTYLKNIIPKNHEHIVSEYKKQLLSKSTEKLVYDSGEPADEVKYRYYFYDKKGRLVLDSVSKFSKRDSSLGFVNPTFIGSRYIYFEGGFFRCNLELEKQQSVVGDSVYFDNKKRISRFVYSSDGEFILLRKHYYNTANLLSRIQTEYISDPYDKPSKNNVTFILTYE